MVKFATVAGKWSFLMIPPFGNSIPVIAVPSKYISSILLHPDKSGVCVRLTQLRTSIILMSLLLPR